MACRGAGPEAARQFQRHLIVALLPRSGIPSQVIFQSVSSGQTTLFAEHNKLLFPAYKNFFLILQRSDL